MTWAPPRIRTQRQHCVLIVNAYDERDMYAEAFRARGLTVVTASTAADGFAAALRERPDAVVVGSVLRDDSGLTLVRRLRQSTHFATTPVLLLTGFVDRTNVAEMNASGADGIVLKPCLPEDLLTEVRRLISRCSR